ncbi:MAG: MDR family MFS transporter [Blastocatellia bacterium]
MNPWRGLKGLPRECWILFFTSLINRMGTMALPFLVLYLTTTQGFSATRAGHAATMYGLGSLLVSPIAGRLCDRYGPLRVMKMSLFMTGVMLLFFPMVHGYVPVLAATFVWAMLNEAFRPANMVLTAQYAPPGREKTAFSLYRLAVNLGESIGPLAGGFLAGVWFPVIFLIDGATAILAGLFVSLSAWPHRQKTVAHDTAAAPPARSASVLRDGAFLWFMLALIPVVVAIFQIFSTVALFLTRDLHRPESDLGWLFTVSTLLIVFLEIQVNTMTAHWPHRRALVFGVILISCGIGAQYFANGFGGMALAMIIWTFGEMIVFPSAAACVGELAPPDRRGDYMGMFQVTFSISLILAPLVGTWVYERYGGRNLWAGAFALGMVSALMLTRARLQPLRTEPPMP